MDQFRGDGFRPVMGMGRGRGRGRGRAPINPDEEGGQGQYHFEAIGMAGGRGAVGMAGGRGATGSPRPISPYSTLRPTDLSATGPFNDSSLSSFWLSSSSSSSSPPGGHYRENTSTWERIDDLPKEARLGEIFGDVKSNSDQVAVVEKEMPKTEEIEKQKKTDEEKTEEEETEEEKNKAYLPQAGFLDPENVTLSFASDTIKPGDKHYCALYTMANTDTIYLIFCKYFSKAVDKFIAAMGRWYFNKVQEIKLLDLIVRDEKLVPGAIVVVYHKDEREWKRARILGSFVGDRGLMYRVLFLDLGDIMDVNSLNIVYLHETWKEKPVFAIKARLQLSHFYNSSLCRHDNKWGKMVTDGIIDAVHNRMVLVKFIDKVEFRNEKTWIVSLLSVKERDGSEESGGGGSRGRYGNRPIEQQVIAKVTGLQYVDDDDDDE